MQFSRYLILSILCSVLILGLSQSLNKVGNKKQLLEKYNQADRLYREGEDIVNKKNYSEEKEEQLNREALASFKKLKEEMETSYAGFDSLLFFINFKIGVLAHYFDDFPEAKKAYLGAIAIKNKVPFLADSFFFKPYLYYGIILYHENQFDSSLGIYKKAELIHKKYAKPLQETERLYNTLGALYYEIGNYRQAKNYTEKSLAVIPPANPYYKELVVNYKINLASILTKLEEFDEANRIYQEILPLHINRDIILHNIGIINLKLGAVKRSLDFFKQVNYTDNRRSRLYNDIAIAFMNIHKNDSAKAYLKKAEAADTSSYKSVTKGQISQSWADLFVSEKNLHAALKKYQEAITNFYPAYSEKDIYKNPTVFSGVFSYINLFKTLSAKAETFEILYQQEKNMSYLKASLDAYTSAYKLADYVEKSYDSDEARLFLSNIKYGVHSKPIDVSLALYELTKDKNYLEQAWQFDQMNKASILSFNIFENELRNKENKDENMSRDKIIRSAITRLSLKAAKENDPEKLKEISNAIRDYEIELGKIQETTSQTNKNKNAKPSIPSVTWLQKELLDKKTSILSYHLSEKELLILCIGKDDLFYRKIPAQQIFYSTIDSFVHALHTVSGEKKYEAHSISQRLYSWLIQPVSDLLAGQERLLIIPDDELNYIPFEALQDAAGNYLVQQFSIQYQYSASLIEKRKKNISAGSILSFAPFANSGNNKLAYSGEEIKDLKGKKYFNNEATKQVFLTQANKHGVVHLATHARVNDNDPSQSYIAFAGNNETVEDRLYAQEIYDLTLDSTQLVILSACETGTGQLIHGEGMMSLSRAFAYAGCPDIVTSLWKAEDRTTAFLARRLHHYLDNKKTTDQALHLAKLDLLNSNEIDERLKTPNYWAHIIFIGEYEPIPSSIFRWWYLIPVLFFSAIVFVFLRKRTRTGKT